MSDDRPVMKPVTYALIRMPSPADRGDITVFSRSVGMHPGMVRRLVALGVLEPDLDATGNWWFGPHQASALARAHRLRAGLGLSWAAVLVVTGLLDRIAELERELRRAPVDDAARGPRG